MNDPLWQHGTCDRIMAVLQKWIMNYHNGTVSATGKYMTKPGEMGPQPQVIERPKRYACDMAWTQTDLDYFIKILEAKVPTWTVTHDLRAGYPKWKNGRLIPNNSGQQTRVITIDLYFQNLVEIYQMMERLRDGKLETKKDLADVDLEKVWQKSARPNAV